MNVKVGDLAIVVSTNRSPETIGAIVEVIAPAVSGDEFLTTCGRTIFLTANFPAWRVRCSRPMAWTLPGGPTFFCYETATQDTHLRPISGIPLTDEVTKDDEVTA